MGTNLFVSFHTALSIFFVSAAASICYSEDAPDVGSDHPTVAFVDVNVASMASESIAVSQTVLVSGDRILSVGPVEDIQVPENIQLIADAGKYVMPGIADMHVHIDTENDLTLFLVNGVTTVRNMSGRPAHLKWRDQIARGERIGPTMYTAGPIIDGSPELWPGNAAPPLSPDAYEVVGSARDGERVVREQAAAGYDFIKVYDNLPKEAYEGVVTAAHDLGLPVVGHVPFGVTLSGALESGIASIEHLRGYIYELIDTKSDFSLGWDKRTRFLAWNHIDSAQIPRVVDQTIVSGTWNVPTLVRYQKNMLPTAEHFDRYNGPEASYVDPAIIERVLRSRSPDPDNEQRYGAFTDADLDSGRKVFEEQKAFVRALHTKGAGLLLGSDDWFGGFSTHQELQNLVDAGLTPYQALATGTVNAAEYLGASEEFGTVAPGRRADLILLEKDPFLDVRNIRAPIGVMVRGRWIPQAELQRMLQQIRRSYIAKDSQDNLTNDPDKR